MVCESITNVISVRVRKYMKKWKLVLSDIKD